MRIASRNLKTDSQSSREKKTVLRPQSGGIEMRMPHYSAALGTWGAAIFTVCFLFLLLGSLNILWLLIHEYGSYSYVAENKPLKSIPGPKICPLPKKNKYFLDLVTDECECEDKYVYHIIHGWKCYAFYICVHSDCLRLTDANLLITRQLLTPHIVRKSALASSLNFCECLSHLECTFQTT